MESACRTNFVSTSARTQPTMFEEGFRGDFCPRFGREVFHEFFQERDGKSFHDLEACNSLIRQLRYRSVIVVCDLFCREIYFSCLNFSGSHEIYIFCGRFIAAAGCEKFMLLHPRNFSKFDELFGRQCR